MKTKQKNNPQTNKRINLHLNCENIFVGDFSLLFYCFLFCFFVFFFSPFLFDNVTRKPWQLPITEITSTWNNANSDQIRGLPLIYIHPPITDIACSFLSTLFFPLSVHRAIQPNLISSFCAKSKEWITFSNISTFPHLKKKKMVCHTTLEYLFR